MGQRPILVSESISNEPRKNSIIIIQINLFFSQSSKTNNDNWGGFDGGYQDSYQSAGAKPTPAAATNRSQPAANQNRQKSRQVDDFSALDVKAATVKNTTNKAKTSIEDDAWDLLNN